MRFIPHSPEDRYAERAEAYVQPDGRDTHRRIESGVVPSPIEA